MRTFDLPNGVSLPLLSIRLESDLNYGLPVHYQPGECRLTPTSDFKLIDGCTCRRFICDNGCGPVWLPDVECSVGDLPVPGNVLPAPPTFLPFDW